MTWSSNKIICVKSDLPLRDHMCEGSECAAYTLPSARLAVAAAAAAVVVVFPASSALLLSVSGGLAPVEDAPSKLAPVVVMASWLLCRSGTLDSDLALCLLSTSIPSDRISLKPPGVAAATMSELLPVENVLALGLCAPPFAVLCFAPIIATATCPAWNITRAPIPTQLCYCYFFSVIEHWRCDGCQMLTIDAIYSYCCGCKCCLRRTNQKLIREKRETAQGYAEQLIKGGYFELLAKTLTIQILKKSQIDSEEIIYIYAQ